jgi:hypothetical protein
VDGVTAQSSLQVQNLYSSRNERNDKKISSEESSVVGCSNALDERCFEGPVKTVTASTDGSVECISSIEAESKSATRIDIQNDSNMLANDEKSRGPEMRSKEIVSPPDIPDAGKSERLGLDHSRSMITDREDEKAAGVQLTNTEFVASNQGYLTVFRNLNSRPNVEKPAAGRITCWPLTAFSRGRKNNLIPRSSFTKECVYVL